MRSAQDRARTKFQKITQVCKWWVCICCWKTKDHCQGNFWPRIRIRNQNQPITSGFWNIWGYVLEKLGFSLLLRLCTGRKNFFWFFSQMSSFSTSLSLQNELLNSHKRFFFHKDTAISILTFIRTTLWLFTLTLWCILFCIQKFILKIFAC